MCISVLPHRRPQVVGLQEDYRVGDLVALNCTSSRSRPRTQLKWLINNEAVSRRFTTEPYYAISKERPDARETILQLRFIIKNEHFKNGILQVKVGVLKLQLLKTRVRPYVCSTSVSSNPMLST